MYSPRLVLSPVHQPATTPASTSELSSCRHETGGLRELRCRQTTQTGHSVIGMVATRHGVAGDGVQQPLLTRPRNRAAGATAIALMGPSGLRHEELNRS